MDKRKYPRVQKLLFAAAKKYGGDGELEAGRIGITLDVSEGGMLVLTEEPLPFMARLELFLGFGETILKISGEVIRLEKQAGEKVLMGIRFLDLDEESRAMLRAAASASPSEKAAKPGLGE